MAAPMSRPKGRSRLRTALQLGVSFSLLGILLSRLDWQRSAELIANAAPALLLLLLALYSADRVLMALKWRQLLAVLRDGVTRREAVSVYYESSFIGFALPFGGLGSDIVRFVRLRTRGIEPHFALASMIMERLIGAVATFVLVVVGLLALARLAPEVALRDFAVVAAAAVAAGAVIALLLIFSAPGRRVMTSALKRIPLLRRERFASYVDAARAYSERRPVLAGNLALSVLEQMTSVLAYWVGSKALGTPLPFIVCLAVAPVTVLLQRLPLSYGGLGLREGSAAALLVVLGYDYSAALVLLMMLFVVFFVSLLPGLLVMLISDQGRIGSARPAAPEPVSEPALRETT